MIEVRNTKLGGERDILVFEVYIPSCDCLLINVKLRINKSKKPYVVFPCLVEEREDGTKRYPLLAQFGGAIGEALKTEILPQLKAVWPDIFKRYD